MRTLLDRSEQDDPTEEEMERRALMAAATDALRALSTALGTWTKAVHDAQERRAKARSPVDALRGALGQASGKDYDCGDMLDRFEDGER